MSAEAMAWVLEHSEATGAARNVASAIANQIGKDTGEGWAYVADVCRWAKVSENTYHRVVNDLIVSGELERVTRGGKSAKRAGAGRRPNLYRMPLFAASRDPHRMGGSEKLRPPQDGDLTPPQDRGVTPPQDGDLVLGTVQGTVYGTVQEKTLLSAEPTFEDFWKAYPRKQAKPAALAAWKRAVKRASAAEILAALPAWKAGWEAEETARRHQPHPTTWLNQDRWNDEPPQAPERQLTNTEHNLAAIDEAVAVLTAMDNNRRGDVLEVLELEAPR